MDVVFYIRRVRRFIESPFLLESRGFLFYSFLVIGIGERYYVFYGI